MMDGVMVSGGYRRYPIHGPPVYRNHRSFTTTNLNRGKDPGTVKVTVVGMTLLAVMEEDYAVHRPLVNTTNHLPTPSS